MDSDEIKRRVLHVSGAFIPAVYFLGMPWSQFRVFVLVLLVTGIIIELIRLTWNPDVEIHEKVLRDYEKGSIAGYTLALAGTFLAVSLFEPAIAVPAVLMLFIADPVSGFLSNGNRVKNWESWTAMFVTSLGIGAFFVSPVTAAAGALGASIADGFKPEIRGYVIDDNLTIPVYAAVMMSLAVLI